MMYVTKSTNTEFHAILERRSNIKTVTLRKVLKSGKLGAEREYQMFGCEKCAEDVIARLEKLNPGSFWKLA